ncbi:MAG: helix-turn-helix domain-containing protein [Betaproteobacteria bacterium]|nr:helix-turn-helix domain-containing protein [Betaproteobacteria bacterium]
MPSKPLLIFPSEKKLLTDFGERLRLARLRRRYTAALVAERAGVSRMTLSRVEQGSPAVTLGVYLRVLSVLNLENDLTILAADDRLGRKLQDLGLPVRQRIRKKENG